MKKNFYLASANTCYGFKNCFDNICPNGLTYILKGGPGTGKSTFMKKVGNYFESKGESVEYFYCSSDIDSLDGIRIVNKNISIVDGTSPHTTEAKMPKITETIVNLGDFIGENVKKHKKQVEILLEKKKICFDIAYNYLKCVENLFQIEKQLSKKVDFDKELKELLSLFIPQKRQQNKLERTLFLSYLSQDGIKSLKDINNFKRILAPNLNYVSCTTLLSKLAIYLTKFNIPHICFYSLFEENRIESIFAPQENILITSEISSKTLKSYNQINHFIKQAGKMLAKAKFYHKKVENFYVKNMDFLGLNKCCEKIISEIEKQ